MRTSACGCASRRVLSIRAAWLFCARSGFYAGEAKLESHGYVERYLGERGSQGSQAACLTRLAGCPACRFIRQAKLPGGRDRLAAWHPERAIDAGQHFFFSENFQ